MFAPHWHWPFVHALARVAEQGAHRAPIVPHAAVVGGVVHVPFAQHPVAQFVAVHPVQR
jgi:hypothetical protein